MDKFSYLMMILSLVILCALPLYCELKTDESLNFDVMGETGDDPEAMRVERELPVEMIEDSSLSKLRKPKHTQKSIKQKDDDVKTVKHRNTVVKFQSRDGKKRPLDAVSEHQSHQKSGDKQNSKNIGNKKSIAERKVRNSLQKHEMKIERDGVCVDDRYNFDERKINHNIEKRAKAKTGKSGRKSKSMKRDINVNNLNEIKPLARKIEVGTPYNFEKKISNTTLAVNLSKNTQNGGDIDDKACLDEHGALKPIKLSENGNQSPSKREGNVPAFNYYKTESFDK